MAKIILCFILILGCLWMSYTEYWYCVHLRNIHKILATNRSQWIFALIFSIYEYSTFYASYASYALCPIIKNRVNDYDILKAYDILKDYDILKYYDMFVSWNVTESKQAS